MSSSAFWTPGLEILTSILAPFSGSMAGWSTRSSMSAQRPVRRAMLAISSRKALCLAERACRHGHVVACLPGAAPHSVPSTFLFLHRLPGSHTGLHNHILAACWNAELCTIGVLETGSWKKPEAPGPLGAVKSNPVSAVGSNVISQVSGGFVDAGECEGALRGCCGTESCQVVGVFTSFSRDGLELGHTKPSSPSWRVQLGALQTPTRGHLHASG